MPDSPTTRLGLYKSLSDGSELVDYSQDIGQNLDKLDAAAGFQVVTSSTRPSSPYSGKGIAESDTSYRTYFSNGTAPASASWVQIPNSSSTFNADLDLTSGKQLNIGASSSTASLAILASAAGDDILSTRITGDTQNRHLVEADGATYWGPGGSTAPDTKLYRNAADELKTDDGFTVAASLTVGGTPSLGSGAGVISLRNATTPPSTNPSTGIVLYSEAGVPKWRNPQGLISRAVGGQLAVSTTVANTTTETVVGSLTIPANDAVAGAVYRVVVFGAASVTGTPTFTLRARLGGVAGTLAATLGATTAGSGITNQAWSVEFDLVCLTTGGSATWAPRFIEQQNVSTASAQTGTVLLPSSTAGSITQDSTVSNDMVVTWAWSAASSSNTTTARGFAYRVA